MFYDHTYTVATDKLFIRKSVPLSDFWNGDNIFVNSWFENSKLGEAQPTLKIVLVNGQVLSKSALKSRKWYMLK